MFSACHNQTWSHPLMFLFVLCFSYTLILSNPVWILNGKVLCSLIFKVIISPHNIWQHHVTDLFRHLYFFSIIIYFWCYVFYYITLDFSLSLYNLFLSIISHYSLYVTIFYPPISSKILKFNFKFKQLTAQVHYAAHIWIPWRMLGVIQWWKDPICAI